MNLSQLILELNLQKGFSETQKMTNTLINNELLGNVKQNVLPLLMSMDIEKAAETQTFNETIGILLFNGKKLKEISEAFAKEVDFFLTNEDQDVIRVELKETIKAKIENYSKKEHKPHLLAFISQKEQEAIEFLANKQAV